MPPIFLLRHGETVWNREGRLQGRLDSPLTALGRVQAARQGAILRRHHIDAPAFVSPRGRALTTAALAGLAARTDHRLAEISMGGWEGSLRADLGAPTGTSWKFSAPGGETQADLVARLDAFTASLRGPCIVVTHGVVCIALRARFAGLDPSRWDELDDPQGVVHLLEADGDAVLA